MTDTAWRTSIAATSCLFSFNKNVATGIDTLALTTEVEAFMPSSSINLNTLSAVDLMFLVEPIPSQLVHSS